MPQRARADTSIESAPLETANRSARMRCTRCITMRSILVWSVIFLFIIRLFEKLLGAMDARLHGGDGEVFTCSDLFLALSLDELQPQYPCRGLGKLGEACKDLIPYREVLEEFRPRVRQ